MPHIGPWVGVGGEHHGVLTGVSLNADDSGGNAPPDDPNDGILRLVWDDDTELKWDEDTILDWTE